MIIQIITSSDKRFLRTIISKEGFKVFVNNTLKKECKEENVFSYDCIKNLCKTLKENFKEPLKILLTVSPVNTVVDEILENLLPIIPQIFYCQHGILHDLPLGKNPFCGWSPKITYLVCGERDKNTLKKCGFDTVYSLKNLPQFENINERSKYSDHILIINGSNQSYYTSTEILENVVKRIKKHYSNKIIIKNKIFKKGSNKKLFCNSILEKFPDVEIINDDFIYKYLNCKFIVVLEGGTSVVESFLANKKVIQFGAGCWEIPYEIKDKLMFTESIEMFEKYVMEIDGNLKDDKGGIVEYLNFLQGGYDYENIFKFFEEK